MNKDITESGGYKDTPIGKIPKEWDIVQLKNICKNSMHGGTPSTKIKEYWSGNIPWITGADIVNQKLTEIRKYLTKEAVKNSATHIVPKGSLLIVTRTGVGKLAIAPCDVAISQDLMGFVAKDNVNIDYLFWILNQSFTKLSIFTQGTSINGIIKNDLMTLNIPLPPRPEQHKIAAILSTVDAAIAETDAIIAKTEQVRNGLMEKLLTKGIGHTEFKETEIGRVPREWKIHRLEEICNQITDGEHIIPKRTKDGFLFISARHVQNGNLVVKDLEYISKEDYYKIIQRCNPQDGDILISCSGSVGRVCLVPPNMSFVLSRSVAIIKQKKENVDSGYLVSALLSQVLQKQILASINQLAQGNLFQGHIKRLRVPIPSLTEQRTIATILNSIDYRLKTEREYRSKLEPIKKGLMQDLLTGRVRVTLGAANA